jgi:hypothetical protein
MTTSKKAAQRPPTATNVHPETQRQVTSRAPGEESSKASSGSRRSDARTGHDKDGNAEQASKRR